MHCIIKYFRFFPSPWNDIQFSLYTIRPKKKRYVVERRNVKNYFNANYVMALEQQHTHFFLSFSLAFFIHFQTTTLSHFFISWLQFLNFFFCLLCNAQKSRKSCTHLLNRDFFKGANTKKKFSTCKTLFYGARWWKNMLQRI